MRIKMLLIAGLIAVAAAAQEKKPTIVAEGGEPDERASARILYWNRATNHAAGQFDINYGRPAWRAEYEDAAKFDSLTRGKVWRMGNNYWTALDTQLPLEISGRRIAPGYYFLGLYRSEGGNQWSLAFIDSARVRAGKIDAFDIAMAPILFKVPVTAAKSDAKVEKLTVALSHPKDDIKNVTMKLTWGNMLITAPIKVTVP